MVRFGEALYSSASGFDRPRETQDHNPEAAMRALPQTLSPVAVALLCGGLYAQASFTSVPGGFSAVDITPDGQIVVGSGSGGGYYWRWKQDPAPTFVGGDGAVAVSDDGSVLLGNIDDQVTGAQVAGIWTQATGWQSLGYLPFALQCPSLSSAYDLSADGTTAVGLSWDGCSGRAFRWTQATGMVEQQPLASGGNRASVISAAGELVAGFAQGTFNRTPAVWNPDGSGSVWNPDLQGEIRGTDKAGTVVLGSLYLGAADGWFDAFYADPDGTNLVNLGSLQGGWAGAAKAISEDGSRIAGYDYQGLGGVAWTWTEALGIQDLKDQLTTLGVTGVPNLSYCQRMSSDGTIIVGNTPFQGGWIVELPVTGKATVYGSGVNPAGSMAVLAGSPAVGQTLTLGLDNPLGTQQPGALPFVVLATAPDPAFPGGTPLPGFGMAPGGIGELLISLSAPNPLSPAFGGNPWAGPGSPAPVDLTFPANPNLVGKTVYGQGVLLDFSPLSSSPIGLTDGVEIFIGS
jgi:uncharacterized membrane protein